MLIIVNYCVKRFTAPCGFFIVCLLLSCAAMGPPGGGPEDKEPPQVVSVYPPSGTTGVDPETRIEIMFTEAVDRNSLIESLFISPPPSREPRVKVRGPTAFIRLPDLIPDDLTTIITIGTGVADLHRNKLSDSFTIAFTAGTKIDSGQITGLIFEELSVQGMLIGAWSLDDSVTIDPEESIPAILTQAGIDGHFSLDFLKGGHYRVMCWTDKDRDRFYSAGEDKLGLPALDIDLEPDGIAWVNLRPIVRDTSEVRPLVVTSTDNRHVVIRFNRAVTENGQEILEGTTVTDSLGILPITVGWWDAVDTTKLTLLTAQQVAGTIYRVTLPHDTIQFPVTGSQFSDTIGPRIVLSFPAGRTQSASLQVDGWIGFDDGLSEMDFTALCTLTVDDTVCYQVRTWHEQSNIIRWQSLEELPPGALCEFRFFTGETRDISGNVSPDTTFTLDFTVVDPDKWGLISGSVSGHNSADVIVTAQSVKGSRGGKGCTSVGMDGVFTLPGLRQGEYIVWAYEDIDKDGNYGFGNLIPFQHSEPFAVGIDTVNVRARWETGGVTIIFK